MGGGYFTNFVCNFAKILREGYRHLPHANTLYRHGSIKKIVFRDIERGLRNLMYHHHTLPVHMRGFANLQ